MAARAEAQPFWLAVADHSEQEWSALPLIRGTPPRNAQEQAARLAEQFVRQNSSLLGQLDVAIQRDYDGRELRLRLTAGGKVGAVPLYSPVTARLEHGLIVKPRFAWPGIGAMLGDMGWRVAPQPLALPLLPRSERQVPAWVLASMVLTRLEAVVSRMQRRFETVEDWRTAPRGSVNWALYATRSIAHGRPASLPCQYPDLQDDREFQAALKFVAQKQRAALEGQIQQGPVVANLLRLAQSILDRLAGVVPRRPTRRLLDAWLRRPLAVEPIEAAIRSMEWTIEDRGLAGVSDLAGVPWRLDMNAFYEAWVERVLEGVAGQTGAVFRSGRRQQTVVGLRWQPGYAGSQKSLIPDFVLEFPQATVIVDAKYKSHWEEMQQQRWGQLRHDTRDQHREDLLQGLAYANLARTQRVVVCLVYPCALESWQRMGEADRQWQQAELVVGDRRVQLWLTALPMALGYAESVALWTRRFNQEFASTP